MAKATILICDKCPTQEPAKDTLTIRRSRGASVELDLCSKHIKEAVAFFGVGRKSKKPVGWKPWNKADHEAINAKILELADSRPFFTGADVAKAAKVLPTVANSAVRKMLADGKITATGNSAGRKLSKAS